MATAKEVYFGVKPGNRDGDGKGSYSSAADIYSYVNSKDLG